MGNVLEVILEKQAKFANLDYKVLDKSKWIEYEWYSSQEALFIEWLNDYLYKLTKKELAEICEYTSLVYRKKKKISLLAYQFNFQYGFKTKE